MLCSDPNINNSDELAQSYNKKEFYLKIRQLRRKSRILLVFYNIDGFIQNLEDPKSAENDENLKKFLDFVLDLLGLSPKLNISLVF